MAKLIVTDGPDVGAEHELEPRPGRSAFTAGRDTGIEIPLTDSAVSRKHFRIDALPGGWRLTDLGSRNQTFLNGTTVHEAALNHGDLLRAGDTELRFENPGAPVESAGVLSTIIKVLPTERRKDELLQRFESIERALQGEPPREALAKVRKLLEVYGDIASSSSLQELLKKLLEEILPALGADRGAVILREKNDWIVQARYAASGMAPDENGEPIRVSTSVIEKVAQEGSAVLSANTFEDERFRDKPSIVGEEISSAIAAPIRAHGKIAGVLYADRRGTRSPFTEDDLQLLVAASHPAGSLLGKLTVEEDLRRENRNLYKSITETKKIIGVSKAVEKVLDFIHRAAPTSMTVLIEGETGTGKELVAAAIHYSSQRKGKPFVAINCAALPENLVESELFGHERGAFTGAVTRRKGRFELADGGTVFLDEVGELSLACQAKLLRLLEEKTFERVGGVESIKADVRIIAASNKNLLRAVSDGAFREDLYYRLSVLNVSIAPLRERPEDIPLLAEHFLKESGGGVKKLSEDAEARLRAYHWPGNIRQLRNVIESAVVLGTGREIEPEDLVLPEPPGKSAQGKEAAKAEVEWQPMSLKDIEKRHIQQVLEHTRGNKKRAADILGIERCTLYAKTRLYGI